jgi:hypothetical protein
MARAIHKLTAREAETIAKPGRHSDGGGLYLFISASFRRKAEGAGRSSTRGAGSFGRRG